MASKGETSKPPSLNEGSARDYFDQATLTRARPYARSALSLPTRAGRTLKALCQGSERQRYRVSVTLTPDGGIESGFCSCPVGHACKHQAALPLAYRDNPSLFAPAVSLHGCLEKRTHAELVAIIEKLVARHPELEALVVPAPAGG